MDQNLVNRNFSGVTTDGSYAAGNPTQTAPSQVITASTPQATPQPSPSPSPISYSTLSSDQTPTQFQQPQSTPLFNVGGLNSALQATYQPTDQEQKESDISGRLQDLYQQVSGEQQYRNTLANQFGYGITYDAQGNPTYNDPGLIDLNTKLTQLTNQAKAIPIQVQNAGSGQASMSALNGQSEALLRQNALQALNVSTLIAAKQGQLQTAQFNIEQAVQQKYGPMEAQINALRNNLDLIKNDPNTTLQDKKRADEQSALLAQRAAQIDLAKTNYTNTQNEVLKYHDVASASQLAQLQQAQTPAEVAQIAASMGLQQPMSGRYQQQTTKVTNPDGSSSVIQTVFDTATHRYLSPAETHGMSADQLNASSGSSGSYAATSSGGSAATPAPNPATGTLANPNGATFAQYGNLYKTDFNPHNADDVAAFRYLDTYVKNGEAAANATFNRGAAGGYRSKIYDRANALYQQATGNPLPDPSTIAGYHQIINANNKLLNNLGIQEGTVDANWKLMLSNIDKNNINGAIPPINAIVDKFANMLGDPSMQQYFTQNSTIQNELSNLIAVKNANGTTVHDKLTGETLLPAGATREQQYQELATLLKEARNSADSIQNANAQLYQYTDPLAQQPQNPARQRAQNQPLIEAAFAKQGGSYQHFIDNAPPGQIPVYDKSSKSVGYIPQSEFDATQFIRI